MPITVQSADGSTAILSVRTALRALPDDVDLGALVANFGRGNSVRVVRKDGTEAVYAMTAAEDQPKPELSEPPLQWPSQTKPPSEVALRKPFNAHCKVLLGIDVSVQCTAIDATHAERMINEVIRDAHPAPNDFRVVFEAGEVAAFILRLKRALETGDLAHAGVTEVLVTGFVDPLRLSFDYRGDQP